MTYDIQKRVVAIGVVCIFTAVFGYIYHQSKDLLEGPLVNIQSPLPQSSLGSHVAVIKGSSKHIAEITLNDNPIYIDKSGHFTERVLLLPGYNVVTVKARDRFGRTTEEAVEVVYKAPDTEDPAVTFNARQATEKHY